MIKNKRAFRRAAAAGFFSFALFCLNAAVFAQIQPSKTASGKPFTDSMTLLTEHFAASEFAAGEIPQGDLDRILAAGIRAPSAGNRQPWRFIVSRSVDIMKSINIAHPENGNIVVFVVMPNTARDKKPSDAAFFDAACASMALYYAAEALGYASRIYTGPMNITNSAKNAAALGVTGNESAVALVRIGRHGASGADAVSHASSRKSAKDIITTK